MTIYTGMFRDVLTDLQTYLEGVVAFADYKVIQGPITLGEFIDYEKPCVSLIFSGYRRKPKTYRGWIMDMSVIYLKYAPSEDLYDALDDAEVIMDSIYDHWTSEYAASKKRYGQMMAGNTYTIDIPDGFVYAQEIKYEVNILEVE